MLQRELLKAFIKTQHAVCTVQASFRGWKVRTAGDAVQRKPKLKPKPPPKTAPPAASTSSPASSAVDAAPPSAAAAAAAPTAGSRAATPNLNVALPSPGAASEGVG